MRFLGIFLFLQSIAPVPWSFRGNSFFLDNSYFRRYSAPEELPRCSIQRGSDFRDDFRRREWLIGKKLFPQFVRPLGGVDLWKKNRVRKSHVSVPLRKTIYPFPPYVDINSSRGMFVKNNSIQQYCNNSKSRVIQQGAMWLLWLRAKSPHKYSKNMGQTTA